MLCVLCCLQVCLRSKSNESFTIVKATKDVFLAVPHPVLYFFLLSQFFFYLILMLFAQEHDGRGQGWLEKVTVFR